MSSIDEMSSVDHVLDHLGDVILVLTVTTQDNDSKDPPPQNPESAGSPHATTPGREADSDVTAELKSHRYRVSSRHLCLASPVFQTMLEGPWQESPGTNNSPREVKTTDWNPEAMLTLLRIFHGRHKAVLKRLTVEQLCEVAILVDYYKCHEAVELYTDLWVPVLKESCPKEFAEDRSLTFLFISVVFRVKGVFDTVIKSIIMDVEGPLVTHLPISPELIERIDARRVSMLDNFFKDIKKLEDNLYEGTVCHWSNHEDVCNNLMLGLLLKGLRVLGISASNSASPYPGQSVSKLISGLSQLESPESIRFVANGVGNGVSFSNGGEACCKISSELNYPLKKLRKKSQGILRLRWEMAQLLFIGLSADAA